MKALFLAVMMALLLAACVQAPKEPKQTYITTPRGWVYENGEILRIDTKDDYKFCLEQNGGDTEYCDGEFYGGHRGYRRRSAYREDSWARARVEEDPPTSPDEVLPPRERGGQGMTAAEKEEARITRNALLETMGQVDNHETRLQKLEGDGK